MRIYSLTHVDEVSEIFMQQMRGFGTNIAYVRESRAYLNEVISMVLAELGGKK